MKIVQTDAHARHDPQFFLVRGVAKPSAEQPERAERLLAAARDAGHEIVQPESFGPGPRAAVHTPEYLRFLAEAHALWQELGDSAAEIVPNVHPSRYAATYPESIVGRAGWHMADTACPIGAGTFAAACASADVATTAAEHVLDGGDHVYALCRPPGHHAYADMAGGFCFLNNSAIAAQHLRQAYDRVAILDVDVHHGNGTQGIFWRRSDVMTISLHADPANYYPFFWGHAHERGEGDGEGYNLNVPLPLGSGDDIWMDAFARKVVPALEAFDPGAIVIALGLDAYEHDPLKGLAVTTPGFERMGAALARLGRPTVLVQEGGYLAPGLGENLVSVLKGFQAAR